MKALTITQLQTAGQPVFSTAAKVTFLVGDGPVVPFPQGAYISPYDKGGAESVIVVHNSVDTDEGKAPSGCWQGAKPGMLVIMNGVPEAIANELLALYAADSSVDGLRAVVSRAEELLRKKDAPPGHDIYTTDQEFFSKHLIPVGEMLPDGFTGRVRRDGRDTCYVARGDNDVIYRALGKEVKRIDENTILTRDYRNMDGTEINATALPIIELEEEAAAEAA